MPLTRLIDLPEIAEGVQLPRRELAPTIMDVAQFIGAAGFAIPIFLDPVAARDTGLDAPVVPAEYKSAFLLAYLRQIVMPNGTIVRLQSGFRRPDYHGNRFTIGGQVTRVDASPDADDIREVHLELWLDQESGERSVRSSAIVRLPD